ncbi:hypothetical protein [Flavobacterium sp.]|uniref:hypothetical protein n=1 Tax=Flavobacterium sp. TaxID=239 RepID=UPI002604A513|nr:hypothetical protein [Flavobacterium sp.]
MNKKFEILQSLPVYGDMYSTIPENAYTQFSEGLAVKFIKKDRSEWIGNLEKGNSTFKFGSELQDGTILIIALGICYILDIESKKAIKNFGFDYKKVFEYKNSLILIGEYCISIVENAHNIKHFDNLCYEGISNVALENENINGILNTIDSSFNNKEIAFSLNLETFEVTINGKTKSQASTERKKWWKIW